MNVSALGQEEKVKYLTTEPVPHLICQMAVPTIISMLVTSFYNMADTFFVGKIDTDSTAAVGVVFSIMALIQACGFFFGHGSGNYISRKLGAKEYEDANAMAACGFYCSFIAGLVLGILGLLFLEPLALLLGAIPDFMDQTKQYLGIILLGTPFMMSQLVLNNQLRFQGSASFAMVGIVTGAVVNIALDPIFIFVFQMGVSGAAAATVVSQLISFCLLWLESHKGGNIKVKWKNFHPDFASLKEIFKGGLPSLCRQGLGSVATICLNRSAGMFAGEYTVQAIAAMSVVTRITMFANSALIGFGQGFQPVCGMNYGAGKYDRVREGFWFCVKTALCFLVVVSVFGILFAEPLVTLFRKDDPDVIRIGTTALRLQCIAFPLSSFVVICNMYLQSIGKAAKASIVAASRQGIFFLPLIWILPYFMGLFGVQISQMISDICSFFLAVPLGISVLREMKQKEN
ncbi:MAG: MATE family efflux transporter [Lachnospiraceae bacterium]|nr:MATE family efflux transporter [Lachnospiraceae bacterium]